MNKKLTVVVLGAAIAAAIATVEVDRLVGVADGFVQRSARVADQVTELHDSYADKSEGALPDSDSGQVWTGYHIPESDADAELKIVGGFLTNETTAARRTAGYIDTDLGARVSRVGARFEFDSSGSTDTASVGILVWDRPFSRFPPAPLSPCHLGITPEFATYAVIWDNAGRPTFEVLYTHRFSSELAYDTEHEAEVVIVGSTALVTFPDGAIVPVTDSRIGSIGGNYAGFEIFSDDPSTDHRPRFTTVWADAERPEPFDISGTTE